MLSPTFAADAFSVSRARCAYFTVVITVLWPSSRAISGSPSPSASACEAKLCRQS